MPRAATTPARDLDGPVARLHAVKVRTPDPDLANPLEVPNGVNDGSRRRADDAARADDGRALYAAMAERLRLYTHDAPETPGRVRETLLDCLQALARLHTTLAQERGFGSRLSRELQQARQALAATRQELAGTKDGERRARHMAQHDSLTSLPNRRCFRARLDAALQDDAPSAPALAVLYLDLDGFKHINDRHGHDTGDELLRIVAQRLKAAVRAEDMVGRLGGDEFACLLASDIGHAQIAQRAGKLFDAVAAPLQVGTQEFRVRPSIGIAVCPTDGRTATELLKRADAAMYRAKRRQLGYAFFDHRADA